MDRVQRDVSKLAGKARARARREGSEPIDSAGRTRSTTNPMVSANRQGLCGVLPIERIGIKREMSAWESARDEGRRATERRKKAELTGQHEHLPLFNLDVSELAIVNHFEDHVAFVLVEPFLSSDKVQSLK
jgi:hypothetical protein